jgi:predicted nuclease of predicted toxin-antitoxin system
MKFLADESLDRPIVVRLREDGHDVVYIPELSPGITDSAVLDIAVNEQRVLITGDKDFGELVFRQGKISAGVVLVRLHGILAQEKADLISTVVKNHGNEFIGRFAVVTTMAVRIRRRLLT